MSEHVAEEFKPKQWAVPMQPRSPSEAHRASTPLELLFDLVFVIAVSQAASALHHDVAEGHVASAVFGFGRLFFAIWWAWMNFTWFASSYDTDDVPYRLTVFVQLTGALILAAGVPRAFAGDYTIVTIGYIVMRLALVSQWLRVALSDPVHRVTAYRYVIGIIAVQIGWTVLLWLPASWQNGVFFLLVIAELLVPFGAERSKIPPWHPQHIAERYGSFTLIVLGESILSASLAIQSVMQEGALDATLIAIIAGGILIILCMWWLYFDEPVDDLLTSIPTSFIWGYGHLVIFAAAAAVGAGLAIAVDDATHHTAIGAFGAGAAVAVPVALYLLGVWALHQRPKAKTTYQLLRAPVAAGFILLTPFTGQAVLLTGLVFVVLLVLKLLNKYLFRAESGQRA